MTSFLLHTLDRREPTVETMLAAVRDVVAIEIGTLPGTDPAVVDEAVPVALGGTLDDAAAAL